MGNHYMDAKTLATMAGTGSEAVCYHIGKYYDKVIGKNYKQAELDMRGDIIYHIMSQ